jgi:hypothetical protein
MHRKSFLNAALTALASSLLPALAWVQLKFADQAFSSEVILNNQKLALNGDGVRFRCLVKTRLTISCAKLC